MLADTQFSRKGTPKSEDCKKNRNSEHKQVLEDCFANWVDLCHGAGATGATVGSTSSSKLEWASQSSSGQNGVRLFVLADIRWLVDWTVAHIPGVYSLT